jgi:hypothetical protein
MKNKLPKIEQYGLVWYNASGEPHRDGDKPAVIYSSVTVFYYKNGRQHRAGDKPAVIWPNGSVSYYKNGEQYYL